MRRPVIISTPRQLADRSDLQVLKFLRASIVSLQWCFVRVLLPLCRRPLLLLQRLLRLPRRLGVSRVLVPPVAPRWTAANRRRRCRLSSFH